MTRLSLALLGGFEVILDDHRLMAFETVKVRALLAYLVVEAGRPHQREILADLLWPDAPGDAARTYLRQALVNLREVLRDRLATPAFLAITRDTIQFNASSDHWLDITAFSALLAACARDPHRQPAACARCAQRLEAAAALYRGPLLNQFFLGDSATFEEWVALKREALHQQALSVLTRLAQYHERRGAYDDVRRVAWRQLELDPWREEAHQSLMRALWRSGERSAALAQYERCRETLRAELGVEPAAETQALYSEIRFAAFKAPALATDGHHGAYPLQTLPPGTTPFIGREEELEQLADLLANPQCQLLTLVGPGGIGKTRLAMQLMQEQHAMFAHGGAFVPLAPLHAAALIVPAMAQALHITLDGREDPRVQLLAHLRDKEVLLVLDNFEHLLGGVGLLIELCRAAPGVTLLITSRQRLGLRDEWVVELDGLKAPADDQTAPLESFSGGRLFLETVRRVQGGRALAAHERAYVPKICRLVEAMPLALEMAGGWVRLLSCQEIAAELEHNLGVLTSAMQDVPERHQSMRVVFDHSWQLLSVEQQCVLRQLAVFRGGWERNAARDIAGAELLLLAALADRSLLRNNGGGRYDMHELTRQYAEEQLLGAGEEEQTRNRHLHYYLHLAEHMEPRLFGADQEVWLAVLEAEHDNLRAALQWSVERREAEQARRLAAALWWFWWVRGHVSEGRRWLAAVMDTAGTPQAIMAGALGAKVLHGAGWLAVQQRDYAQGTRLLEQSLVRAEEAQDTERTIAVLHDLAQAARLQGDHDRAVTLFTQAAALGRESGDTRLLGRSLGNLGVVAHAGSDKAQAANLLTAGLDLMRALGDKVYMGWFLSFLGRVEKDRGDYEQAATCLAESLTLFRDLEDRGGIAFVLEGFAGLAGAQGAGARAAHLFGVVAALRLTINLPVSPFDQPEYDRDMASIRDQLDDVAFAAAWAAGQAMTLEQAIAYALDGSR